MQLYSKIRSIKWALTGYPADKCSHFLSDSQRWSRSELEGYRNAKLRALIEHCYRHVPYYRDLMDKHGLSPREIQVADDLWRFPILTKDAIRSYSLDLMADNIEKGEICWSKTGGTTGEPMRIPKDQNCSIWENMCYERGLCWGGLDVNEPRIELFGGSLGLEGSRFSSQLGAMFRKDLFLPAFELKRSTADSFFRSIKNSGLRFIRGYASALYRLAVLAQERNYELCFQAVFPTAELILPEWKAMIEKTFQCQILPYYGCGEVNSLGFTCSNDTSYLIPEEHVIIETTQGSEKGKLVGEGRFLITSLNNMAMPMIRYDLGDAGVISSPGELYPFNRITRLDGRFNSFLLSDTGDQISGVMGTHILRNFPSVETYQIVQLDPLHVRISLVPKNEFSNDHQLGIEEIFKKLLGSKMKITVEIVKSIPRPPSGKSVFVINRCL